MKNFISNITTKLFYIGVCAFIFSCAPKPASQVTLKDSWSTCKKTILKQVDVAFKSNKDKLPEDITISGKGSVMAMQLEITMMVKPPEQQRVEVQFPGGKSIQGTNEKETWRYNDTDGYSSAEQRDTSVGNFVAMFDTYEMLKSIEEKDISRKDTMIGEKGYYLINKPTGNRDNLNAKLIFTKDWKLHFLSYRKVNNSFVLSEFDYNYKYLVPKNLTLEVNEGDMNMVFDQVKYDQNYNKELFYKPAEEEQKEEEEKVD